MRYFLPRNCRLFSVALTVVWAALLVVMVPQSAEAPELLVKFEESEREEAWLARLVINELPPPSDEEVRMEFYRTFEGTLEPEQLKELLELAGFEGEALHRAWAVVMKESRGNTQAHNNNSSTGDNSYGLFQINMIGRMGPSRRQQYGLANNEDLFNPLKNAEVAFILSKQGTDFGHWGIGPNAYAGGKPRDYPYWLTQYPEESDGRR